MADEAHSTTVTGTEKQTSEEQPGSKATGMQSGDHSSEGVKETAPGSEEVNEAPQTNGASSHEEHTSNDVSEKTADILSNNQNVADTEMQDTHEPSEPTGDLASHAALPTNGTPASSKRASGGGSARKKSSAVPEHKSKKLHKKKSKPLTNLSAQPGEYYIARMKGHPPWPSIICDEDMLPSSLLNTRPVTAQLPDGSFKKSEYADGGKRAYERTYPIMFLHTNEFAWIPNTELAPLDVHSDTVKTPIEKGKSKTLLQAYKKAADNEDLDHFKGMLADHQKALEADIQEREELEKERAAKKAKKASRKSDVVNDEDEMDVDENVAPEKPKSRKRKKAEDSEDMDEKPAKTPKTATKLKLSTPKTPAAEPSAKKKSAKSKAAKATKSGSEDDAVTPRVEEKPITPQQAKEMKEKKVLYYRHKLQRGFLTRDATPKEEEMRAMSDFLGELEGYPDLEGSIIRATKIHKVLKAMIKLPSIPLDEEYKFKTRSVDLLAKWNEILLNDNSAGPSGDKDEEGKAEDAGAEAAPTTNGASKTTEEQVDKVEADTAPALEKDLEAKASVEGGEEAGEAEEDVTKQKKTTEEEQTDAPALDSAAGEADKPDEVAEATA